MCVWFLVLYCTIATEFCNCAIKLSYLFIVLFSKNILREQEKRTNSIIY